MDSMKYVYECLFTDKPDCNKCMIAFSKMGFNDETHKHCAALGSRPICPEEGCRKDCPLKKID